MTTTILLAVFASLALLLTFGLGLIIPIQAIYWARQERKQKEGLK